jgi:hypothetical protein
MKDAEAKKAVLKQIIELCDSAMSSKVKSAKPNKNDEEEDSDTAKLVAAKESAATDEE